MNVLGDKRLWYAVAALIVVVIVIALLQRGKTEAPPSPATSAPATTQEAPAKP